MGCFGQGLIGPVRSWPMALQPPTGKFSASPAPRWQAAIRPQVCRLALVAFGFPGSASCKESDCQCRRCRSHGFNHPWVIEWGRSHGEGHGNPFQYSCLENFMGRGDWQATVHRVTKSQTRLKWLSTYFWHPQNYLFDCLISYIYFKIKVTMQYTNTFHEKIVNMCISSWFQ